MPKIRNVSGEALIVPALGRRLVLPGQLVDVPADGDLGVFAYTQQPGNWAPGDDEAQAIHDAVLADIAVLLGIEDVTEKPARELVDDLADMDVVAVAAVLEAEQARTKPRTTVLAAAEKRLTEFNTPGTEPGHDDSTLEG